MSPNHSPRWQTSSDSRAMLLEPVWDPAWVMTEPMSLDGTDPCEPRLRLVREWQKGLHVRELNNDALFRHFFESKDD